MEIEERSFRCIRLEWQSMPMSRDLRTFEADLADRWPSKETIGLYAFEGKHDGHQTGTILYVGMTVKQGEKRPNQSAVAKFFRNDPSEAMYGSYWDMTLRWAVMNPQGLFPQIPDRENQTRELAKSVESLLIVSMKPPLNTREVND